MWFSLTLLSLFIYLKILNIKNISVLKIICGIAFSPILTYFVYVLKTSMPYARFVIMILAMGTFARIATGVKIDLAFTAIVISMGIAYGLALVAALVSSFIMTVFIHSTNSALMLILFLTIQFAFIITLFKIRRFKNGMSFLKKRGAGVIGLIVSGIILIVMTLINNRTIADETLVGFLFISAILCIVGIIRWWRNGLTKIYREMVNDRNIQEYETGIAQKNEQIHKLQESNDFMAKLIHRDNKLLLSMYEAVRILNDNHKDGGQQLESQRILEQIEQLINERTGLILQNQRTYKSLPSTKDKLIDGVINHMLTKATEKNIQFDLVVDDDISELTKTIIPSIKLQTLIADLLENAIIATSHNEYRKILVIIGIAEEFYELTIQDSGIPFENETLQNLGQQKTSTHLNNGGSGIGYMTIFEILNEFKASLVITEHELKAYGFTKSIKVRFDNCNTVTIPQYCLAI